MSGDLDLTRVDVLEFLEKLVDSQGNQLVTNISNDGQEARFSCPYPAHGFGDQHPSAFMNLETTAWICFSCGESGNAITFAADTLGIPKLDAKNFIAQKWHPQYAKIDNLRSHVEQMLKGQKKKAAEARSVFVPLPESTISAQGIIQPCVWNFPRHPGSDYMFERGFTPEILEKFEIVYDTHRDRPCITVRTPDGGLVGFKGRAWRPDQDIKYLVSGDTPRTIERDGVIYGFEPYDASQFVYAAHLAEPVDKTLVLIEGEFNVMSAHQKEMKNAVGPSGSTLGDVQVKTIASMCDQVVIFFDTDPQNQKQYMTAKLKILKAVKAFEPLIRVRVVDDHVGDPAEMEAEELHRLVNESVTSTRWRINQALQMRK